MQETILTPGDPIQARCTKCKENTASVVVSMVEGAPEKVQCSICSRKHKYRPPSTAKRVVAKRPPPQAEADLKQWQALLANLGDAKTTDYSMTASFKAKALINHPVFGLGLVQRLAGPQKVEILFESGTKTMRCK